MFAHGLAASRGERSSRVTFGATRSIVRAVAIVSQSAVATKRRLKRGDADCRKGFDDSCDARLEEARSSRAQAF
jgi:hypothetical protein